MSDPYVCDDDFDFEAEEDDDQFDCGLGPDGQCSMAGSEDCDWECPHSHGAFYAGSEHWNRRHDAGVPVAGCKCDECTAARRGVKS